MSMMKSSNTEWLGDIPAEWDVAQIGNYYELRNEKVSDYDFEPLSVTMKGIVPQLATAAKSDDHSNRKLVKKGDFVINSRSDRRGSCGISPLDGSVSLINIVMEPRGEMNPQYYNWLFHTEQFADEFYKWGHGIVDDLWTTRWQEMKKILIVAPSPDEQQAIADYLDKTCSKIDEIIAEAKASIDEYKELKIGQINKYTIHKMKRTKLKYITEKIGDGIHATPEYSDEGTIRFINGGSFGEDSIKMIGPMLSNEEYQKQNKSLLNEHTVMIALNGANFGNTSLYNNEAILLGKSAGYITLKSTVCREYVRYCFENSVTKEAFDLSLNGTTIPNLSLNTLRNTEICLPDYSVQKQLAKTIKKMIIKMDSLIAEKESLINDLEAYKKSLIYEVVTGKRRVV